MEMTEEEAKYQIQLLTNKLNTYNHAYYVDNKSLVSDFEFDKLLRNLQEIESQFPKLVDKNSPTKRVGGDITKKFQTVRHDYPMLSLSNTYSQQEIIDWENRIQKIINGTPTYVCELKYDGLAIGVRYENGSFLRAVTRGDGTQGEDVSANVRTIKSIPLQLKGDFPENFEIRGEIIFPFERFNALNKQRIKNGEEPFANPRNTAAGTIKLQDSSSVAERGLDCFLYGIYGAKLPSKGHFDSVQTIAKWGFNIPDAKKNYIAQTTSIDGIMEFISYWDKHRNNLPFGIDGIVIKVDEYELQEQLGSTAKFPRWAIAYKFETEQAKSKLEHVSYQVGRTGAVTPVANLAPIELSGTTVRRASLHNEDQINLLDLHKQDTVLVEKGGEIIPKVVGVDLTLRKENAQKIQFIKNCPECNTPLSKIDGEAQHYCPNELGCPPQITGKIIHFISRKAMDIEGIGPELVVQLFNKGLIKNCADLYQLTFEQITSLERMGEKSANNLLSGLATSKKVPFERVLFALGIRYVGETVAKKVAKSLKNSDAIITADYSTLIAIDEVGEKIALSILSFFKKEENIQIIEQLKRAGLQFKIIEKTQSSSLLEGKSIVVSGVFSQFSRKELKAIIEENGGKNVGSISSKTSFLIAGENMGPAKLQKAQKLGIQILSENEFIQLINSKNG